MSNLLISHGGSDPEGYNVTTSGTLLAAASDYRRFIAITNASDEPIYLALSSNGAEVGKGVYIAPNGGAFELNNVNMYYGEIWAIHDGVGNKRVCVQVGR